MESLEIPMKEIELKKILMEIKSEGRTWEEESIVCIIKSMVEHINYRKK